MKEGLEANRKLCLKQQTELRKKLQNSDQFEEAKDLFFKQHAMLHTAQMAGSESFSLEDEVFDNLSEKKARRIPPNSEHSILWNIWHIARIEDVAMNLLVSTSPQVLHQNHWLQELKIDVLDTGNAMSPIQIADLSKRIEIQALRAYRMAVGRKTRQIVKELQAGDLSRKVDPARLVQVKQQGAVVEAATSIIEYWSKRNIAGLLLMPATRHSLVHLNESFRLKEKR